MRIYLKISMYFLIDHIEGIFKFLHVKNGIYVSDRFVSISFFLFERAHKQGE